MNAAGSAGDGVRHQRHDGAAIVVPAQSVTEIAKPIERQLARVLEITPAKRLPCADAQRLGDIPKRQRVIDAFDLLFVGLRLRRLRRFGGEVNRPKRGKQLEADQRSLYVFPIAAGKAMHIDAVGAVLAVANLQVV